MLEPAQSRMWVTFIRVMLRMSYEMNRELQLHSGISLADYHVLNALAKAPKRRMQMAAIATRVGWERSRASHQVKRMSVRKLVTLGIAPHDRRGTEVTLTEEGVRTYRSAGPKHLALVQRLFVDGVEPEMVAPVTVALESVYENLIERGSLPRPEFPAGDDVVTGPRRA